jgi:hypothetical protein
MSSFDPYYDWLGIPPAESANGGPNHYRLLGLQTFEGNPRVIENAADRLMTQLRGFAAGPNGKQSQKLLNEVAAARACLLDEVRKATYDKPLRDKLAAAAPRPQVITQPVYVHVPVPVPVPTALPPMPSPAAAPPPPAEAAEDLAWPNASPKPFAISAARSRGRYRDKSSAGGAVLGVVKVVMGGLGGLSIAVLGVWVFFKADPFGLFERPAPVTAAANTKIVKTIVIPAKPSTATEQPQKAPAPTTPIAGTSPAAKPSSPSSENTKPATTSPTQTATPPKPVVAKPAKPIAETTPKPETNPAPFAPEIPVNPTNPSGAEPIKLRPAPSTAEQQAKLAELKELYKSEFDAGLKPAGREAFVEFLLDTTDRLKSDAVARFVLLREAYGRLVQLKDFAGAADIIDRLDGEFEMDPFKLRLHLLTEASPAARLPADRLAIVQCASELAEQAMSRQRMDEADKLVRMAEGQAKTLSDSKLRAKMTALRLEVEKLAEGWGPVERARQTLAANPTDAAAALVDGKHRCLIEGDWKAGLESLAKSNDPALSAAARQDLAGPTQVVVAGVIGDQWYEIARSEKAFEGFFARARHWYKQVASGPENLDQARIQQRIEQIEALNLPSRLLDDGSLANAAGPLPSFAAAFSRGQSFDPVDLLQHVQRQDLVASPWGATTDTPPVLYSDDDTAYSRLPVRYPPPREYQLTLRVRRGAASRFGFPPREQRASGPFVVGLVGPKSPFVVCLDLPVMGGEFATFLSVADAKTPADNPTYRKLSFAQIPAGDETTIVCQVRRKSVSVMLGGNEVCRYEGDFAKLALPKEWSVGDPQALFVGSHQCGYAVTAWTLEPLPANTAVSPAFGGKFPSAERVAELAERR